MALPPFNPNENLPADDDIVSQFPAVERTFRDIIESWLNFEHDPSGHHAFMVDTEAARDGVTDWVVGSLMYNTDDDQLQILTDDSPVTWTPVITSTTGTWTPAFAVGGSTTGLTYSVQSGTYERIGNIVYAAGRLTMTSDGSLTGAVTITGLPYPAAASPASIQYPGIIATNTSADVTVGHSQLVRLSAGSSTLIPVFNYYDEFGTDELFSVQFDEDATSDIVDWIFSITYRTDAAP